MQAFNPNPPTAVSEIPATEALGSLGERQLNSVYPNSRDIFAAVGGTLSFTRLVRLPEK